MQIVFLIFAIWLLGLSAIAFWILGYFRKLSKEVGKGNLIRLLDKIVVTQVENKKHFKKIESELNKLGDDAKLHTQKVGLVRFNPFQEMGGDHSFSLSLLNKKEDGIMITGLHSRERTRVYAKQIKHGKCSLGLSNEEKKALKIAQK